MTTQSVLARTRVIVVAPKVGVGGVGDYAEDFIAAVAPHVGELVEHRHDGPGEDTVAQLREHRRAIARCAAEASGPVLVHAELSGGSLVGFWGTSGLDPAISVTATVHDPPHSIWWPARTRFMARHKLINHAVHFPLRPLSYRVQRRYLRPASLFVLTASGARSIPPLYPSVSVTEIPHVVAQRPVLRSPELRPRAVGFFGLVYRGKGFEQLEALRGRLPADIALRVAGRGTEDLEPIDGVEIVGGVDGPDEDTFFDSVGAIVMPYGRRSPYGMGYPASGVMARAVAYQTPVICTDHGALADHGDADGVTVLRGAPEEPDALAAVFADEIVALLDDRDRLRTAGQQVSAVRAAAGRGPVGAQVAAVWEQLVSQASVTSR